jgi:hypothetical protein
VFERECVPTLHQSALTVRENRWWKRCAHQPICVVCISRCTAQYPACVGER